MLAIEVVFEVLSVLNEYDKRFLVVSRIFKAFHLGIKMQPCRLTLLNGFHDIISKNVRVLFPRQPSVRYSI